MFQNNGTNDIGIFDFSYQVLNFTTTNICEEGFTDVPPCVFNLINSYQEGFTDVPTLDNCTCDSEPMIESTPPWLWIVVAIVFMLLTILTILMFIVSTVLACIVRKKNKDLNILKTQHRTTSGANCMCVFTACIIFLSQIAKVRYVKYERA